MSGHTPGPWLVEDPLGSGPGDSLWIVQEGASSEVYDWRNLAVVCSDDPEDLDQSSSKPITVAERDANAHLIAAAPDMAKALDAARALATCCMAPGCYSHEELTDMARAIAPAFDAAIAKARNQAVQS